MFVTMLLRTIQTVCHGSFLIFEREMREMAVAKMKQSIALQFQSGLINLSKKKGPHFLFIIT